MDEEIILPSSTSIARTSSQQHQRHRQQMTSYLPRSSSSKVMEIPLEEEEVVVTTTPHHRGPISRPLYPQQQEQRRSLATELMQNPFLLLNQDGEEGDTMTGPVFVRARQGATPLFWMKLENLFAEVILSFFSFPSNYVLARYNPDTDMVHYVRRNIMAQLPPERLDLLAGYLTQAPEEMVFGILYLVIEGSLPTENQGRLEDGNIVLSIDLLRNIIQLFAETKISPVFQKYFHENLQSENVCLSDVFLFFLRIFQPLAFMETLTSKLVSVDYDSLDKLTKDENLQGQFLFQGESSEDLLKINPGTVLCFPETRQAYLCLGKKRIQRATQLRIGEKTVLNILAADEDEQQNRQQGLKVLSLQRLVREKIGKHFWQINTPMQLVEREEEILAFFSSMGLEFPTLYFPEQGNTHAERVLAPVQTQYVEELTQTVLLGDDPELTDHVWLSVILPPLPFLDIHGVSVIPSIVLQVPTGEGSSYIEYGLKSILLEDSHIIFNNQVQAWQEVPVSKNNCDTPEDIRYPSLLRPEFDTILQELSDTSEGYNAWRQSLGEILRHTQGFLYERISGN